MDLVIAAGDMTLQQIKDPAANVQSIPRGMVLGIGVSMAGGAAGDVIRMVITDPTGATFSDNPLTFTTVYWHVIDSGSLDRFLPCEWRAGPERDGDRHIGAVRSLSRGDFMKPRSENRSISPSLRVSQSAG
jgi:hypothetical protein